MKLKFPVKLTVNFTLAIFVIFIAAGMALADTPRVNKDQLKEQMGDPDLLIVDVRLGAHWDQSVYKIKGAVRVPIGEFLEWAAKYPKDTKMILYCA